MLNKIYYTSHKKLVCNLELLKYLRYISLSPKMMTFMSVYKTDKIYGKDQKNIILKFIFNIDRIR